MSNVAVDAVQVVVVRMAIAVDEVSSLLLEQALAGNKCVED